MSVWIVAESESDLAVLKRLLPDEVHDVAKFYLVGDRSSVSSVAGTLLVKHREPVAVVVDTHSLDAGIIREKYVMMEHLLRNFANGTRFEVILAIPALEALFFERPEIMARAFPAIQLAGFVMLYKTDPHGFLKYLFEHGGGPRNLAQLLDALTDDDVEKLQKIYPIPQLATFVQESIQVAAT